MYTKARGESVLSALGVFVIANERRTLKITLQNNGGAAQTLHPPQCSPQEAAEGDEQAEARRLLPMAHEAPARPPGR